MVCTRDLVASSRISETIAGVVKSSSAELIRVEVDTAFLIKGPVSRMSECIGFREVSASMMFRGCVLIGVGNVAIVELCCVL